MLLALRINVLAKGHSGISLENVEKLVAAFNGKVSLACKTNKKYNLLPFSLLRLIYPTTGDCGMQWRYELLVLKTNKSSFTSLLDLCPLAHLALGLLGEGRMWSPRTGWCNAAEVLEVNGLKKMELGPKEGLALINGTQMVSAIGSLGGLEGFIGSSSEIKSYFQPSTEPKTLLGRQM